MVDSVEPKITIKHYHDGKLKECVVTLSDSMLTVEGYPDLKIIIKGNSELDLELSPDGPQKGTLKILNSSLTIKNFSIVGNSWVESSSVTTALTTTLEGVTFLSSRVYAKEFSSTPGANILSSELDVSGALFINGFVCKYKSICKNLNLATGHDGIERDTLILNDNFTVTITDNIKGFYLDTCELLRLPKGDYHLSINREHVIHTQGLTFYHLLRDGITFGVVEENGLIVTYEDEEVNFIGDVDSLSPARLKFIDLYLERLVKGESVNKELIYFKVGDEEKAVYPAHRQLNIVLLMWEEWELYPCLDEVTDTNGNSICLIRHAGKTMHVHMNSASTLTGVIKGFEDGTTLDIKHSKMYLEDGVTLEKRNFINSSTINMRGGRLSDVKITTSKITGVLDISDAVIFNSTIDGQYFSISNGEVKHSNLDFYYGLYITESMVKNTKIDGHTGVISNCYVSYLTSVCDHADVILAHRLHYGTFNSIIDFHYCLRNEDIEYTPGKDVNVIARAKDNYLDINGHSFPLNETVSETTVNQLIEETVDNLGIEGSFNTESLIHQIQSRIDVINLVSSN